jgi:chorismate mutase-like protein
MTHLRILASAGVLLALTAGLLRAQTQTGAPRTSLRVNDPGERVQTPSTPAEGIAHWRSRIDATDRRIIKLLNERATHVSQLIPLKAQAGQTVRDPARERAVLEKLKSLNTGPLPDESIVRIYEAVMAEMRILQEKGR